MDLYNCSREPRPVSANALRTIQHGEAKSTEDTFDWEIRILDFPVEPG